MHKTPRSPGDHRRKSPILRPKSGVVEYYGYRDYDAQTGRWTGRDPIDEVGGPLWFDKIEKYTKTRREFDDELIELIDYFELSSIEKSILQAIQSEFHTKILNDLYFASLEDWINPYQFCLNDALRKYDYLGLSDRGGKPKRNLSCEGFDKNSNPNEVEKARNAARAAGQTRRARALSALLKVIKRGGILMLMWDFIELQMRMEMEGDYCCPSQNHG